MKHLSRTTLLFTLLLLCSCATGSSVQNTQTTVPDTPLAKSFDTIVFSDFETTDQLKTDYPEATGQCLSSAMSHLMMKKKYKTVGVNKGAAKNASTLIIHAKINDMRIVSTSARIWGGFFAGQSYINMEIELIDAASGTVLRKKDLSSSNNAFAATWVGGSSDQSLPSDMGGILAEYISSVVPKI